MHSASRQSAQANRSLGSIAFNKYSIIPAMACLYALIVHPIIISSCPMNDMVCLSSAGSVSKVFWPILVLAALAVILPNRARLTLPTNIVYLLVCLAFAGTSVAWAYNAELSFIRYLQQIMIVTTILFTALTAERRVDMTRVLFACFAVAAIINCFYLVAPPETSSRTQFEATRAIFRARITWVGSRALPFCCRCMKCSTPAAGGRLVPSLASLR